MDRALKGAPLGLDRLRWGLTFCLERSKQGLD